MQDEEAAMGTLGGEQSNFRWHTGKYIMFSRQMQFFIIARVSSLPDRPSGERKPNCLNPLVNTKVNFIPRSLRKTFKEINFTISIQKQLNNQTNTRYLYVLNRKTQNIFFLLETKRKEPSFNVMF